MSSANRDLLTILGQTPGSQLSGFDLPVGPGASWTWPAVVGAAFDTTTAAIGTGWFGLPTALAVQDNLFKASLAAAHVGQINLPWAVAAAVKIDSTPTVSPSFSAFWSVSSSASANGYKCFGFDIATGLTGYRVVNDAGTAYQINGAAMPLDTEVIVGQFFDGTNITAIAMDPLTADISTLIPETAVGASGAIATANNARIAGVDRVGTDLLTDMDIRAICWVNSPTFGLPELKDAMRHVALLANSTLPGVGGPFSINPRV
jgi:hypothetical protein